MFTKKIFKDPLCLYLMTGNLLMLVLDSLIWRLKFSQQEFPLAGLSGIRPVNYLILVLIINSLLGFTSYEKEKEISHLLFSASLFVGVLIFLLELFYIKSLNSYV